jgi:hypothetical protein
LYHNHIGDKFQEVIMKKSGKVLGTAVALTAIAAAATYFLTGKRGQENREKISAWTLKMKGEVLQEMKKMKEMSNEGYVEAVDEVVARYGKLGRVSAV